MYIYESHLGGLYTSNCELDEDSLYCETCNDSDELIGEYDGIRDFLIEFADNISVSDSDGGYPLETILSDIGDDITYDEAKDIILNHRKLYADDDTDDDLWTDEVNINIEDLEERE